MTVHPPFSIKPLLQSIFTLSVLGFGSAPALINSSATCRDFAHPKTGFPVVSLTLTSAPRAINHLTRLTLFPATALVNAVYPCEAVITKFHKDT